MADFNPQGTAADIINNAAVECGLSPTPNPLSSTDPAFVQLVHTLTTVGRELLAAHDWQELTLEGALTINYGSAGPYAVPVDFDRMVNTTAWDPKANAPVSGAASPQEWQALKAAGAPFLGDTLVFRIRQRQIYVFPTPPAGSGPWASVNYEYISRGWVRTNGGQLRDYVEFNDDTLLLDAHMLTKRLKLAFLSSKGFDTSAAADEFRAAFDMARGKNLPAMPIALTHPSSPRNVGCFNVPVTGYGA